MPEETTDAEVDEVQARLRDILKIKSSDPSGPTYQSLRKLNAKCLLEKEKFAEAAFNMVEAIAPAIRTMGTYRHEKATIGDDSMKAMMIKASLVQTDKIKNIKVDKNDKLLTYLLEDILTVEMETESELIEHKSNLTLDKDYFQHMDDDESKIANMRKVLKELPDEWTVIQLTAGYDPSEQWKTEREIKTAVKEFYLTVLKSSFLNSDTMEPFTVRITPEKVKVGEIPIFQELCSLLEENVFVLKNNLRATANSVEKYWEKRRDFDSRIKSVITTMDRKWLQEWRCLLNGRILSEKLQNDLMKTVDDICLKIGVKFSDLQKMLLYNLFNSASYLSSGEISSMLRRIYIDYSKNCHSNKNNKCKECGKLGENICRDIGGIIRSEAFRTYKKAFSTILENIKAGMELSGLKKCERGPVVLLVDEKLDSFPWEVISVLLHQPVTRMECLGFAHALFKKYEDNMRDGYFQLNSLNGNYLLNPDGDLTRMEKRIRSFLKYWIPQWEGKTNILSSPDLYEKYLHESDVFLYCGHGDGSQSTSKGLDYIVGVKAVVILSGCCSVSNLHPGTRLLPIPTYSLFHIATCPSIIGMLWEVTDLEVDKITSMLLSLFIPSKAPVHWGNVNKAPWSHGELDMMNDIKSIEKEVKYEWQPNLLKALADARRSSNFVMIAASVISRGLPVKINPKCKNV